MYTRTVNGNKYFNNKNNNSTINIVPKITKIINHKVAELASLKIIYNNIETIVNTEINIK